MEKYKWFIKENTIKPAGCIDSKFLFLRELGKNDQSPFLSRKISRLNSFFISLKHNKFINHNNNNNSRITSRNNKNNTNIKEKTKATTILITTISNNNNNKYNKQNIGNDY